MSRWISSTLTHPLIHRTSYNVLFKAPTGEQSPAQIEAFEDTWHWNSTAEQAFDEVMTSGNSNVAEMLRAIRTFDRSRKNFSGKSAG
jgi:site-specific DNA-methyltransferase (adenine-specific)